MSMESEECLWGLNIGLKSVYEDSRVHMEIEKFLWEVKNVYGD